MNEDRFISQQWYNHGSSLKLEAEARKKIDQKIHEKVNNNLGTWIDWQYLLDAAALLAKVCASLSKQSIGCNDLVQRAPYSIYHKSVTKKGFKWISCVIGDRMLRKSMPHDVHSKKRASCNKSVNILQQTSYQQADIRTRSHGLRQLVDDKSVESCQQSCCKLIVKTCYQQAC